ncbi:hypothetical protein CONPUDRAFT_159467 [Coniophora puteana RWD-64-598 SS2]|uniref:Uncharacterized protein n=1 Tax=Coniophora puteana (strain RWD-64-598) TaxID=741705 RepID=A0A5M3M9K4_CONPW|nr:uncharacterized protein CONPUDRAFT_159467 [Coniophora puteana RWD-64-598 SS2]EIW75341.1 hypothetical protein CONPUDRAFT_159467 [Coniophora puteana RWD-64-598 SS2]
MSLYQTKKVKIHPSVTAFLRIQPKTEGCLAEPADTPPPPKPSTYVCQHLRGAKYAEFLALSLVRGHGGLSPADHAHVRRKLFPHKLFPPLGAKVLKSQLTNIIKPVILKNKNPALKQSKWMDDEKDIFNTTLRALAHWEVDPAKGFIKSMECTKVTGNWTRKQKEASLPEEEQHALLESRKTFTPHAIVESDVRKLTKLLGEHPLAYDVYMRLSNTEDRQSGLFVFLYLHKAAKEGWLEDHRAVVGLAKVFQTKVYIDESGDPNLKSLAARSEDALSNPCLVPENVARAKWYAKSQGYSGPWALASDDTKVRRRLSYSPDFGGYVIGSVVVLSQCSVDNPNDLEDVLNHIYEENAVASQYRAILMRPVVPGMPPVVVALLPSNGKEKVQEVHKLKMVFLSMAAAVHLPVVTSAADGAAVEAAAQLLMDQEVGTGKAVVYENICFGLKLRAPIHKHTGLLVSITCSWHGKKTSRNNPQYGAHTAMMGIGHVINQDLIDLYKTGESGLGPRNRTVPARLAGLRRSSRSARLPVSTLFWLVQGDVKDVNKQDDGAARRLYSEEAFYATTSVDEKADDVIKPGFKGLNVWLFMFGVTFEAYLHPTLIPEDSDPVNLGADDESDLNLDDAGGSDDEPDAGSKQDTPPLDGLDAGEAALVMARDSALSADLDAVEAEVRDLPPSPVTDSPLAHDAMPTEEPPTHELAMEDQITNRIRNANNRVSVTMLKNKRHRLQSLANVHSKCRVCLNPKYFPSLTKVNEELTSESNEGKNTDSRKKMSSQEMSHCIRIHQAQAPKKSKSIKKVRQLQWYEAS